MSKVLDPEIIELFKCLSLACVLGGLIGLERDIHGRAAGLRTHLLVALGSSLFMVLSKIIASSAGAGVITDPGRIAAQIVTGIGFIGAGAIMKEGLTVRGLTTAACLWVVAAIGMACGSENYVLAIATTFIALIALSTLQHIDKLYSRDSYRLLNVKIPMEIDLQTLIPCIKRKDVSIVFVDFERNYETAICSVRFSLRLFHRGSTDKISQEIIGALEGLKIDFKKISWSHGKMY